MSVFSIYKKTSQRGSLNDERHINSSLLNHQKHNKSVLSNTNQTRKVNIQKDSQKNKQKNIKYLSEYWTQSTKVNDITEFSQIINQVDQVDQVDQKTSKYQNTLNTKNYQKDPSYNETLMRQFLSSYKKQQESFFKGSLLKQVEEFDNSIVNVKDHKQNKKNYNKDKENISKIATTYDNNLNLNLKFNNQGKHNNDLNNGNVKGGPRIQKVDLKSLQKSMQNPNKGLGSSYFKKIEKIMNYSTSIEQQNPKLSKNSKQTSIRKSQNQKNRPQEQQLYQNQSNNTKSRVNKNNRSKQKSSNRQKSKSEQKSHTHNFNNKNAHISSISPNFHKKKIIVDIDIELDPTFLEKPEFQFESNKKSKHQNQFSKSKSKQKPCHKLLQLPKSFANYRQNNNKAAAKAQKIKVIQIKNKNNQLGKDNSKYQPQRQGQPKHQEQSRVQNKINSSTIALRSVDHTNTGQITNKTRKTNIRQNLIQKQKKQKKQKLQKMIQKQMQMQMQMQKELRLKYNYSYSIKKNDKYLQQFSPNNFSLSSNLKPLAISNKLIFPQQSNQVSFIKQIRTDLEGLIKKINQSSYNSIESDKY